MDGHEQPPPDRYTVTRGDLLHALRSLNGDVKVALFRSGLDAPSLADAILEALLSARDA